MKLEEQVCSLELAKKLKELGVEQDSLFYWNGSESRGGIKLRLEKDISAIGWMCENYSAFTVAELGEMLPHAVLVKSGMYFLSQSQLLNGHNYNDKRLFFEITYSNYEAGAITLPIQEETEADARAKMLIYLIENDLLKN